MQFELGLLFHLKLTKRIDRDKNLILYFLNMGVYLAQLTQVCPMRSVFRHAGPDPASSPAFGRHRRNWIPAFAGMTILLGAVRLWTDINYNYLPYLKHQGGRKDEKLQ